MTDREQRRAEAKRLERNRAWVEWLARERITLLRVIAFGRGIDDQQVDDVVQTALANFLRSFPGPDDTDAVVSYAVRTVGNTALKSHRRHGRKESRNLAIASERSDSRDEVWDGQLSDSSRRDPLERVIERETVDELREKLAELPYEQRAALALSAAGYRTAEIAAALGLSERATRKRIEYGNRALRDQG